MNALRMQATPLDQQVNLNVYKHFSHDKLWKAKVESPINRLPPGLQVRCLLRVVKTL